MIGIRPALGIGAALLGGAGLVTLAGCGGGEETAPAPKRDRATEDAAGTDGRHLTSTGDAADRIELDGRPTVVHSVKIPDAKAGEALDGYAELALTNDVTTADSREGARRWQDSWRYDVRVGSRLVLATSPDATSGIPVDGRSEELITPQQHHGAPTSNGRVVVPDSLDGKDLYLNVVADATTPDGPAPTDCVEGSSRHSVYGDACVLGVDKRDGRAGVVRLDGDDDVTTDSTRDVRLDAMPFPDPQPESNWPRHVALSLPLGDVAKGEVLEGVGRIGFRNPYDMPALVTGELVLADSPDATDGLKVSTFQGENVQPGDTNVLAKRGAIEAPHHLERAFLNYVVRTGAGATAENPGGEMPVEPGTGELTVKRLAPE